MNTQTFKTIRAGLGFTPTSLASVLGIATRTVERWESGKTPIPAWAAGNLREFDERAAETVAHEVELLADRAVPEMVLVEDDSGETMPLGWQRMIAARVLWQLPHVTIRAAEDPDG